MNKTMSFKVLIGIYSFWFDFESMHRFYFVNPLGLSLIIRFFLSLHLWPYIVKIFMVIIPLALDNFVLLFLFCSLTIVLE